MQGKRGKQVVMELNQGAGVHGSSRPGRKEKFMNQDRSSLLHGTYMQRKLLKKTVAPRAAASKLRNLILHTVPLQIRLAL